MALAAPRKIIRREARDFVVPVKAGVTIYQSALVILAAGYARPGREGQGGSVALKAADAATYRAAGVALETVVGGAGDGDVTVKVQRECWNFKNSASLDAITLADVGSNAFIVDDETVARTSNAGARAVAGRIVDVDAEGVWVDVGRPGGAGPRTVVLPFAINETDTLAGTSAELVSPVSGNITSMSVIVQKAVTTGGDVTAAVGVTAVAGLACTIADGAAKGTIVTDTPTAGDASTVVKVGDRIQVVPGAPFAIAGAVSGYLEITY